MELQEHEGESLRYLTVEPDGYQPERRYPMVILLHGFGSHMGDLAGLSQAMDRHGFLYAFPNAPIRLELGYGAEGYGWATSPEGDGGEVAHSEEMLAAFVEEVVGRYQVVPGQVVLGGFSQGGMMTYQYGLPNPQLFRGLMALSSMVRDYDGLRARLPPSRAQSIFIAHGTKDTMIPLGDAHESHRFLEAEGYKPEYREYEMGHEITQDVLVDLGSWLRGLFWPDGP